MNRIRICLLIAAVCAPIGCAEMNPWKSDELPQPKTPPGSLNPVSTELPPPSPGYEQQHQYQYQQPTQPQGLPGGVQPSAGMPGHQFGAAPSNMMNPHSINAANLGQSIEALQADLNREQQGSGGFAATR